MAKKKKSNNRSLTLVIIVMAIICVFVGYLVGLNLFRWMQDGSEQTAQTENGNQQPAQQGETDSELNQAPKQAESESESQQQEVTEDNISDSEPEQTEETSSDNHSNVYKIQLGAFSQKSNAESFKKELEDEGYDVIIKEASNFKVRVVGEESREETEKIEAELIKLGYDTFIVK